MGNSQATALPARERPVSPPPTPRPGEVPNGRRPPSAALADQYRAHLQDLMDGPPTHQGANRLLWEHGEPIQRPTAQRPPTETEKAAFREIARNIKDPAHGDHRANLRTGEYAGTLDLGAGPDGKPAARTLSHGFYPGGSGSFNPPEGSRPAIFYHSHPDNPALDQTLGRPATANAMPSWQDQVSASRHYASHGAKDYLITGDQVKVYDGKGGVTELKPSPLQGELPRAGTPLPSERPADASAPPAPSPVPPWLRPPDGGRPASAGSGTSSLFQRPLDRGAPPTPGGRSDTGSDGSLFQIPVK